MRGFRRKTRIKQIVLKCALASVALLLAACVSGSFLLDMMWSALGSMVLGVSLPVAGSLGNAEMLEDTGLALDIMDEVYPVETVIRMSYSNSVGCETNYSINVSGSNVEAVTGAVNIAQNSESTSSETSNSNSGSVQQASGDTASALNNIISRNTITGNTYTKEQLSNYVFTKGFYTVAGTTSLTTSILKPKEFLEKDMTVAHGSDTPQILLFHTHSQEGFADSVEGDDTTTILGVGDYLAKILTEKYGYNVIHDRSIYDYVDGKLDRSKAYTYAENGIAAILKENPGIDVVIDLHRDGVAESTRLVTQIDGKQMAKVMLFNGISYSNAVGNISYLSNPYRDDNLAMSLQLQLLGEAYYPGFLRNIYINAYRYCLNQRAKSMLIEAGAQTNTFEEVKNSMEPLADLLDKLLRGEKAY
jgi:stage II sporulation protein P